MKKKYTLKDIELEKQKTREYWQDKTNHYRNKYLNWMVFGLIIIFLGVIILIVGLVNYTTIQSNPNYHIILNECQNTTIENPDYYGGAISRANQVNLLAIEFNAYVNLWLNNNCSERKNRNNNFCVMLVDKINKTNDKIQALMPPNQFINVTNCELKEVDEIDIWSEPTHGIAPVNCSNLNPGGKEILNRDGYFCHNGIIQRSERYSKKQITKEWLDNNCECTEHSPDKLIAENTWSDKCIKYKCFDYEVTQ